MNQEEAATQIPNQMKRSWLSRAPSEALVVASAVSQYVGSAIAFLLFASVPAQGVAWLRVLSAGIALAIWRRPWRSRWTGARLRLAAAFGVVLALMNLSFYLAIVTLPLGTAAAIEFLGPITVAAFGSRTRRDAFAVVLALAGVILLADVHLAGSAIGVGYALAAATFWGCYVVLGHRLAAERELRPQDGLAFGMLCGAVALTAVAPAASPALTDPVLLGACIGVGLLSNVVPFALEQVAMLRLPRARFALLLSLLPATATCVGIVFLGQIPSVLESIGIAMVIVAAALRSHVPSAPVPLSGPSA